MPRPSILDQDLLRLTPWDSFRVGDAVQNVLVTGGTGSGKTSGSGKALRAAFLRSGMGGLVLCAKPEEAELWRNACAEQGRAQSLIEWDGANHGFNFIGWELARQGGAGLNAVIDYLMRILEMARLASASPARSGEAFWEDTSRQILRNSILVLFAATGTVRIADLLRFVRSAPQTPEQMVDPAWQERSFFCAAFTAAAERLDDASGENASSYWRTDFATLDPKTRGNIVMSLTTALDRFNHGWLSRAYCGDTTLVPELAFHGAIILLNMPALVRNEDGIVAQQLFKFCFQRAVLTRNALPPAQRQRPVFLWADEAQYFINSYDAEYLSTCRGSLGCTVFLSQSLPTYYARMPGENARDRVHHLLGNFATKIWHSNACAETNEWAARTVGRTMQRRATYNQGEGTSRNHGMGLGEGSNWGTNASSGGSMSISSNGGWSISTSSSAGTSQGGNDSSNRNRGTGSSENTSWGYSEQMDHKIEPAEFGRILKTGGHANRGQVTGVWFQAGRTFEASGSNTLLVTFAQ